MWRCALIFDPKSHLIIQPIRALPCFCSRSRNVFPLPSSCQSPCPGSLYPYSQPDWHLRPGHSGVNDACLLVLRILGMLTIISHHHASLTALWFPECFDHNLSWALALTLYFSITSYYLRWLLQSRVALMYVWTRPWLILPTHLHWVTIKKSQKPYIKEVIYIILYIEHEGTVSVKKGKC